MGVRRFNQDSDYGLVPKNTSRATIYSEGNDTAKALDLLADLSDDSELYTSDYTNGLPVHSTETFTGEEIAQDLEGLEEIGYAVGLYGPEESIGDNAEIYVAFSEQFPRTFRERISGENPSPVGGKVIEGVDPQLDEQDIWQKARDTNLDEIRTSRRIGRAVKTPFIVGSI